MTAKLKTRLTYWGLPALVILLTTTVAMAQQLKLGSETQAEESTVILESPTEESPVVKPQQSRLNQRAFVHDIPSPRHQTPPSWVVDLTGSVSREAIDYIDRVCDEVNAAAKREMCVVVVDSIQGNDHRQFAKQLFNHWRVGNTGLPVISGDWSDNGILLFFAMNERKVELTLGDGIDNPKQQKVAQKIIDDQVIPNMNADDPDSAMYQAIRACGTQLVGVADLQAPVMLPSVAGELPQPRGPRRQQRGPVTWWPWLAGGGLLGGFGLLIGGRHYYRYRNRQCENCKIDLILLKEDQDDQFLDPGQQIEEHLGSVDYDVWACLECEEVICNRYGKFFTRYSRCPDCRYKTVHKIESTVVYATYSHGGKVLVRETCQHCDYHRRYTYLTPRKVKTKSSSSSSFSGSSRGGSGFGGGKSSGGGASGSW